MDNNIVSEEGKASMKRGWPQGDIWKKRKIVKCSDPTNWYADKIGEIVTVKVFVTFGAYDDKDRYISYYDLSNPI